MRRIFMLSLTAVSLLMSCERDLTDAEKQEYVDQGQGITKEVFNTLSGQLTAQMELGGPARAIPYCNVTALPLTDELSEKHHVVIKRSSDRFRNEKNKATERETEVMGLFREQIEKGEDLIPLVEKSKDGKVSYYAPIRIQAKCLACHGTPGVEMAVSTDSILRSMYPEDKARNYKEGELRGLWSLTFKE